VLMAATIMKLEISQDVAVALVLEKGLDDRGDVMAGGEDQAQVLLDGVEPSIAPYIEQCLVGFLDVVLVVPVVKLDVAAIIGDPA